MYHDHGHCCMKCLPNHRHSPAVAELKTSSDVIDALSACIVSVFDGDEVHNDYSATELQEWIGTFSAAQMQNLNSFFESMPSISYDIEWTCEKCGVQEKTELRGLLSFFM